MSFKKHALRLAAAGERVFPLIPNGKLPDVDDFPTVATMDADQIAAWWTDPVMGWEMPRNIGVSTNGRVVLDVDMKDGRNGEESLLRLELEGIELPETYEQYTPTGGRHLVFRASKPVSNSVQKLGSGLDVRGQGGFIVGSGSVTEKGTYTDNGKPVADAPPELLIRCGFAKEREELPAESLAGIDEDRAATRFEEWLKTAPRSVKGNGGDACAYNTACKGRDFGCSAATVLDLMLSEAWDDGCGWTAEKLQKKVEHAFRYAKGVPGNAAAEIEFKPVAVPGIEPQKPKSKADSASHAPLDLPDIPFDDNHPVNRLNRDHAFVVIGGEHYVLWETTDAEGRQDIRYLSEGTFHRMHVGTKLKVAVGDKTKDVPVTQMWMSAPPRLAPPNGNEGEAAFWRRSYKGVWFDPSGNGREGYYNAWRGFQYPAAPKGEEPTGEAKWALDAWVEHIEANLCNGDVALSRWLIGWFAHLVQRPAEKPLVALVMRGTKGVGKNAAVERVNDLLGGHGLVTDQRRYLTGQFNGHFERLLLFVLDEAIWAGDKQGEGQLKGLVTSKRHLIERKGKEAYPCRNFTRVVIIGNEEWLVPASHDERRYAVFTVGEGRKQQTQWFERMRTGMERGGYPHLLRYLLDYDISDIDVNVAPKTEGLLAQKRESLDAVEQWWEACLTDGTVVMADTPYQGWPEAIACESVPSSLQRYFRARNINGRVPAATSIGRRLKKICPSIERARSGQTGSYLYNLPPLDKARADWSAFLGHDITWD